MVRALETMNWNRYVFQHKCYPKLHHTLSNILTAKHHKTFICDSHPTLCRNCITLRTWLQIGKTPPTIYINTKKGIYKCTLNT